MPWNTKSLIIKQNFNNQWTQLWTTKKKIVVPNFSRSLGCIHFFHHLHSAKIKYYEKKLYFLINQTLIVKNKNLRNKVHGKLYEVSKQMSMGH
jgi:hypothetical protein